MVRYTVKGNKFGLGWEGAFGKPNGTTESIVTADIDWLFLVPNISLTPLKASRERVQPWFVGNTTRKVSYTYDTEHKAAEGNFSGDLKHSHCLCAVLGGVDTITVGADADTFDIVGGTRDSFFGYFQHNDRGMAILGCIGTSLSLTGSEGNFISFDMGLKSRKFVKLTGTLPTPTWSTLESLDVDFFHWKHVANDLQIGGVSYTIENLNEVESFTINIQNETEYKFGAPKTGGSSYATWIIEKKFNADIDLKIYPEDPLLWALSPSEDCSYANLTDGTFVIVPFTSMADGPFEIDEIVTEATSTATGRVLFIDNYEETGFGNLILKVLSGTWTGSLGLTGEDSEATATGGTISHNLTITYDLTLQRDTDDYIIVSVDNLITTPISEDFSSIDVGVDPISFKANLASSNSDVYASVSTKLRHATCPYKI